MDLYRSLYNEIKYSVELDSETTKKCFNDIEFIKNSVIFNKDRNFNKLFLVLSNSSVYKEVISNLIKNLPEEEKVLYEYSSISKKLNRSLNKEELFKYFSINEELVNISDEELISEVNNYIKYRVSFNKVFNFNLRLVYSIAKKYDSFDKIDLIHEGAIGLIKSIYYYDVNSGFEFSTYAATAIDRFIKRAYVRNGNIRIPYNAYKENAILKSKISELENLYKRKITLEELSLYIQIPLNKIKEILDYNIDICSLNDKFDEEHEIIETVKSEINMEEEVTNEMYIDYVISKFNIFTEKEKFVINHYFGLNGCEEMSRKELSETLSLSSTRISQIIENALKRLKGLLDYESAKLKYIKN